MRLKQCARSCAGTQQSPIGKIEYDLLGIDFCSATSFQQHLIKCFSNYAVDILRKHP